MHQPPKPPKFLPTLLLLLSLSLLLQSCSPKLLAISTVFRHGARYPLSANYDIYDSNQTRNMSGTLTTVGMRQLYLLGSYMREDYVEKGKVINGTLFAKEVEMFASPSVRCVESAISYAVGLFPFGAGAVLPENISEQYLKPPFQEHLQRYIRNEDKIIKEEAQAEWALKQGFQPVPYTTPTRYFRCSRQNDLVAQRFQAQKVKLAEFHASQSQFIQRLKTMFNLKPQYTTLLGLNDVYDVIICDMYLGRKLPDTFTQRDLKQLTYIQAYLFTLIYSQTLGRAFATSILSKTLQNFESLQKSPKTFLKKYTIFSGHDTNVVSILTFLNLTSAECLMKQWKNQTVSGNCVQVVPFASNVVFQMHEDEVKGGFFVRVKYNGVYYGVCGGSGVDCEFGEFVQRVRSQFVDFDKQCPTASVEQQTNLTKPNIQISQQ